MSFSKSILKAVVRTTRVILWQSFFSELMSLRSETPLVMMKEARLILEAAWISASMATIWSTSRSEPHSATIISMMPCRPTRALPTSKGP
ncbi:hypothetical protein EYF80_039814 [Liparis tanakae]|uniref:Uncharacterized protein n=1 Tax=Liparis tanakae TaxID=230148 RepID=A0A4Z2G8W9_9TELE|nr:hypothetical protein EYF80_039814 [Liparis tanakae]